MLGDIWDRLDVFFPSQDKAGGEASVDGPRVKWEAITWIEK